jgi:hypothetical protein
MDPGEPFLNKELRWSTAEFEGVLHEFKIFSWRDVHEMYLLMLWQIEINVFLGGEFPHRGGKTNVKLGIFCCRFSVFWKNNLPVFFLSKMLFLGRKFHNTSTEFLVWGGVCFRNFCTHCKFSTGAHLNTGFDYRDSTIIEKVPNFQPSQS